MVLLSVLVVQLPQAAPAFCCHFNVDEAIEISRTGFGKGQTIDALINEEALIFAQFLRNERREWVTGIWTVDIS
jgi:hypothetical protein